MPILQAVLLLDTQSPFAPHRMSVVGRMGINLIVLAVRAVAAIGEIWCLWTLDSASTRAARYWRIVALLAVALFIFAGDLVNSWFS